MIKRTEFAQIDTQVKKAIQDTFDDLKINNPENYLLFIADAEYNKEYDNPYVRFNPYTIDSRLDGYKDLSRLQFLTEFLTNYYSFPSSQLATDDNQYRMHIELMIYAHVWESKPFLKQLYRLAHLNNGEPYNWNVLVPPMGKHDFIRNDIRKIFGDKGSTMFDIIKNGFHTTFRNAFAHSEYSFDTMNNANRIIILKDDFEGWEPKEISFDDWSKRFLYSAFLSYHLLKITRQNRIKIIDDFSTDTFNIKHPTKQGGFNDVKIKYKKDTDSFNFAD